MRPPRRKAEFDPYATLAIRAGKRSHNPNFISFLDQGPTIGCQLDRGIFRSVHGALHVSCRQALTVTT